MAYLASPPRNAMSVPGRMGTWMSAISAEAVAAGVAATLGIAEPDGLWSDIANTGCLLTLGADLQSHSSKSVSPCASSSASTPSMLSSKVASRVSFTKVAISSSARSQEMSSHAGGARRRRESVL